MESRSESHNRHNPGHQQSNHIDSKEYQEKQEILMVPIPKTIVHKGTVMVEFLHAFVTKVAMLRVLWSKRFAVHTHVV